MPAALFWKAWRESRGRFLSAIPVIAMLCWLAAATDLDRLLMFPPPTLEQHIWATVYDGGVRLAFVVAVLLLGLGGLRAERMSGSDAFTMSLPVTRRQLAISRALVGIAEMLVLAIVPLVIIPIVSARYQDHAYPVVQAWRFFVLFAAAGAVWFATAFLWSVIFAGEYTAAAAAMVSPVVDAGVAALFGAHWLNLLDVMSGAGFPYLDSRRRLLLDPPVVTPVLMIGVAAALLVLAASRMERDL